MPLIRTHELSPESLLNSSEQLQIYNCLDTTITFEVFEAIQRLFNQEPSTYAFERALQGPVLDMMLRGFRIDEAKRQSGIHRLKGEMARLQFILDSLANAVWGRGLNPRSYPQLKDFFYKAMNIPEVIISDKGQRRVSVNREALEKIEVYFHAMPIVACVKGIRETAKLLEMLQSEVDPDQRMRCSYNIAGTNEDRLSSSASSFGSGTNLQNVTEILRDIFVADPGWKLCVIDLEQADSREIGLLCGRLFGDWSYLDACESGDLHTLTAKLCWKSLPWTGDLKKDRAIADAPFYRHFSRRDMSKRLGHGTNFFGKPFTLARNIKVPVALVAGFQQSYLVEGFPCIPRLHRWTAQELQTTHRLTTSFGRERTFFGRADDESTLREGLAYLAASPTAMRTNLAMYRHWDYFKTSTHLLAQTHDSITFQYKEKDEGDIVPKAVELMKVPLTFGGRTVVVPSEAKVGWNWQDPGKLPPKIRPVNPNGLVKFKGKDERIRV